LAENLTKKRLIFNDGNSLDTLGVKRAGRQRHLFQYAPDLT
jgi:hypothetical protein